MSVVRAFAVLFFDTIKLSVLHKVHQIPVGKKAT